MIYISKFINCIKTLNFNDWLSIIVIFVGLGLYGYCIWFFKKTYENVIYKDTVNCILKEILFITIYNIIACYVFEKFPSNISKFIFFWLKT